MATKQAILDEKNFLSDRISTQVRTVALSLLAAIWLFLVPGKDAPVLPSHPNHNALLLGGLLCLLCLICDYVQYMFGYIGTKAALEKGPGTDGVTYGYDTKGFSWQARTW